MYKEWRFFWFPNSDRYAASDELLVTTDTALYTHPVDEAMTTDMNDNPSDNAGVQDDDDEAGSNAGGDNNNNNNNDDDNDNDNDDDCEDDNINDDDDNDDDDDDKQPIGEIKKIGNKMRMLHGSRVYKSNNKQLPRVLAGVICKMHYSPHMHIDLLNLEVTQICMNSEHWYWVQLLGVEDINNTHMPWSDTAEFVMLQDFCGGANGRVW